MSDSVNAENLRRLSAEFQKDFERREAPNGVVGSVTSSRGAAILERTSNPVADATSEETFTVAALLD